MISTYGSLVWVAIAAVCAGAFVVTGLPDYAIAAGVFQAVAMLSVILDLLRELLRELQRR